MKGIKQYTITNESTNGNNAPKTIFIGFEKYTYTLKNKKIANNVKTIIMSLFFNSSILSCLSSIFNLTSEYHFLYNAYI